VIRKPGSRVTPYLRASRSVFALRARLSEYERQGTSTHWPTLHDRKEAPTPTGESGPITPQEEYLFRENPEQFAGDARFVGRLPRQNNEDYG